MFSYMFSYTILFIYLSIFSTFYPFRVLYFVLFIYCIHVLFLYYFHISIFMYCSFPIFPYLVYFHIILYFYLHSYTVILYFPIFSSCTFSSYSYNCLYFHRIAVLCFSYHVFYTCHFLLGFMSAYTLEVDMGITVCTRRYYHCTRQ